MNSAGLWRGFRRRASLLRGTRARALQIVAGVLRRVRPGLATEERLLRLSWSSRNACSLDEYKHRPPGYRGLQQGTSFVA